MERIVVGTDLTGRSSGAVRYAADLAKVTGANLHLVSAYASTVMAGDAMGVGAVAVSSRDVAESVGADLASMASDLRREGLAVETHACPGTAADMLCKVAETVDADLIVVGNRRMKGMSRVLGSVPNKVAHHASCAVLIANTGE